MSFQSTKDYIVSAELALAVNAAISLEKPLLITSTSRLGLTLLIKSRVKFETAIFL